MKNLTRVLLIGLMTLMSGCVGYVRAGETTRTIFWPPPQDGAVVEVHIPAQPVRRVVVCPDWKCPRCNQTFSWRAPRYTTPKYGLVCGYCYEKLRTFGVVCEQCGVKWWQPDIVYRYPRHLCPDCNNFLSIAVPPPPSFFPNIVIVLGSGGSRYQSDDDCNRRPVLRDAVFHNTKPKPDPKPKPKPKHKKPKKEKEGKKKEK